MNDLTKFTIITLGLGLSLTSCGKEEMNESFVVEHNHDHVEEVIDTTPQLTDISETYELAPQYVIDEAIAEAEYMGLSVVLDYLNDVDVFMRDVDGGAFYSAQDGTVLGTSVHFEHERPYIVLDVNNRQDGFVLVHEMLHHYRQVENPQLHDQFGFLTINIDANGNHSQEIAVGTLSDNLPSDWSVVEAFEYAAQITAFAVARGETSSDVVGPEAFEFIVNHFNL